MGMEYDDILRYVTDSLDQIYFQALSDDSFSEDDAGEVHRIIDSLKYQIF